MRRIALTVASSFTLAACAMMGGETSSRAPRVTAELRDARGQTVGTATFTGRGGTVRLVVQAKGLTPGKHGIHVHAVGKCDGPEFTTAGGHFNPLGLKHGLAAPDGPHGGDLPNLEADGTGAARYEATTNRLTLGEGRTSLFDADGSALVIHEKEDDQKTDPTGNSGGRVACGVIRRG